MQWGKGCEADAVYEVRQYKDYKEKNPDETYHIGFNCRTHVPKKNAHQYIIEELSFESHYFVITEEEFKAAVDSDWSYFPCVTLEKDPDTKKSIEVSDHYAKHRYTYDK